MRIRKLELFAYDAPFRIGYRSTHLLRRKADSLILAVRFEGEASGYGESAPRGYVTGETPESVAELILGLFAERLVGRTIDSFDDACRLLEEIKEAAARRGMGPCSSALGAVDMALLDALGKEQGMPLFRLLGPEVRRSLPWSLPVPLITEKEIRGFCAGIVKGTFGSLKVLVGPDESQNRERLKLLRSLFGREMDMRLEVNGNWTLEEAYAQITSLSPFGISAVEQPVAKGDLEGLRAIRETFGIPVIADESLCCPEDAERLIAAQACDILNIKISKVGGLIAAKRIADFALSRGVPCLLGAHVGETDILTTAALHFLITAPGLTLVEGFSSLLFDPRQGIDDLDPGQRIAAVSKSTGLGYNPEDSILAGVRPLQ